MTSDPDVATFLDYSGRMMDINALIANWEDDFVNAMANLRNESVRQSFRTGFAKSLAGRLTPREYEDETGWDFDTREDFQEHLQQLWVKFYGTADPTDSLT